MENNIANKKSFKSKRKEFFLAFRNTLYLTSSKAFIAILIAALTFLCATQVLDIIRLYTKEDSYVVNSFKQGPNFNYETSEPFKQEVKLAFSNILSYSLKYQDADGFSNPDLINYYTETENKNRDAQIKTVLSILDYQVSKNSVDGEYLSNGFVKKSESGTFFVNRKAVEDYYTKVYADLLESEKRTDEDYRVVAEYLDGFDNVLFAVFDHEKNRLVSNAPVSTSEEAQKYFSSLENCLMVFNSKNPYYIPGSIQDLFPIVQELSVGFGENFDFLISFSGGMVFNENCKNIEKTYNEIYSVVAKKIALTVILSAIGILFAVLLLRISGRREHKGAAKYALTDRLPNEIHIAVHILIAFSMLFLSENSVYLILNPHLGTSWLTLEPSYLALRAEICSVIFVLFTLAAVCCIKRHLLHKTLFKNTIIFKIISSFKKKQEDE